MEIYQPRWGHGRLAFELLEKVEVFLSKRIT